MADSTQFQIDIDVPSAGTSSAADAVARLQTQLTAAGEAATAASEAVRAGESAYRAAEASANKAASAVEKIGLAADAQRGKLAKALETGDEAGVERAANALAKLTARQAEMVAKADAAKGALAGEAASLDKLKAASAAADAAEEKLTKSHKAASDMAGAQKKATDQAAAGVGKVNELAEGFGKLGGPAGAAGQKIFGLAEGFKKLGSSAGAAGPYVAVAIAIIAIATAAITATVAITAWAFSLSDAANKQSLLYSGMVQSASGGAQLEAAVNRLATRVPQTTDKLRSMAAELAKTGLRGKELEDALDAAAVKAANTELGPDWAKGMNSLEKQADLLKLHISQIFRLNTDGLAAGLSKIIALFDETSATGKAIKVVFESLMQPLIDGLTELVPHIVSTFIQFEIWALKALIAIKPYGSTIAAVGKALAIVAAVIVGVVVVAFAALAAGSLAFLTVFGTAISVAVSLGETLYGVAKSAIDFETSLYAGVGGAIDFVIEKITSAIDWLSSLSLSDIGSAMVAGLVAGITGGGGAVLDSLTGVVNGAVDGVKSLLGIHSPSTVFAEIGSNTGEGMVKGVDSSADAVQASLGALVNPSAAVAPLASATPAAQGSSNGKNFSGANFIFQGVKDGEDAYDRFLAFIEGAADQADGGVVA